MNIYFILNLNVIYIRLKKKTLEASSSDVVSITRRLMNQSSLGHTKLSRYCRISLFEMSGAFLSSFFVTVTDFVDKTRDSTTAFFQRF